MLNKSVAIIGAGLSGAICAKALNGMVEKLTVFEQDSHVGGRLHLSSQVSTTSFFTVSTLFFEKIVDSWIEAGWARDRSAWDVEVSEFEVNTLNENESNFDALPNTTGLVKNLLDAVNVCVDTQIVDLERARDKWRLFDLEGNYCGLFDCVVFTAAIDANHELLAKSDVLFNKMKHIEYSPAWCVAYHLEQSIHLPYDSAVFIDSPIANFYVNKTDGQFTLCLVATPEWSETYSALPQQQVQSLLLNAFCQTMDVDVLKIKSIDIKFWPNKTPINIVGEDCLFDESLGLGACGDWCTAPRVEGAVLSGFSVADRVMKFLS